MNLKTFFKTHKKSILMVFFLCVLGVTLFIAVRKFSTHTIVIGHPDNIVVISPNESQDVVVIGNPHSLKVKPNNKNKN